MEDRPTPAPLDVAGALTAARTLLAVAEADADRVRADALRYARQREQEAELLVAKARRLLSVAEEKAAGILVAARAQPRVIDLDAPSVSIPLDELTDEQFRRFAAPRVPIRPTRLDRVLASAVADAVDRTFPQDARPEG